MKTWAIFLSAATLASSVGAVILVLGLVSFSETSFAADPVDLRDKKGMVDPKDLKQHDPKEPSLKIKEPPPPPKSGSSTSSSVDTSSDTVKGPPSDEGGKPGPATTPGPKFQPRWVPPQKPVPNR